METTIGTTARVQTTGAYDRAFYSSLSIVMAVLVFAGFAPTFYLRSYFGAPVTVSGAKTLSPLAIVHGTVFTLWVLLFVVQTALVAARRVAVHRRLGVAGAVLAAVMVVLGTITAIAAGQRGSAALGFTPRGFLIVPLADMVLFTGFIVAAVRERRNKEAHKRLMLLAYLNLMIAAFGRLPQYVNPLGPFGPCVLLAVMIAYDAVTRRRVHPVYLWGGAIFVLSLPARIWLASSPAWQSFAALLIG